MKRQNPIQAIIFDLGGVILNIDYHQTKEAFQDLGFPNFHELFTQFKQSPLFVELEKGAIDPGTFLAKLRQYGTKPVDDDSLIRAWNAMLLDLPMDNLAYLKKLRQHYKLYLLSNTNAIHYKHFFDKVESLIGERHLANYFDEEYYSHLIGKRKPDEEVFSYVIAQQHLQPGNTLIIDDSPQHLEKAKQMGLRTWLHEQNLPIAESLASWKLLG